MHSLFSFTFARAAQLRRLARSTFLLTTVLGAGLAAAVDSHAETYPSKPIRLMVPYSPGGLTDGVARTLAPKLSELLGQSVYIENRGGGGSAIGTAIVAKAPPDGYTILMADQALISNPSLFSKLPYDTLKDLQPVAVVGAASSIIVAHPSLPAHNLKEVIALAKAKPGELNYASGGNGTSTHLAGELFKQVAGIEMTHIPYKGVGPAVADLVGGQVLLMVSSIGPVVQHIKAGKVKALAVTGPSRSPALPDVPTLAEAGFASASVVGYWGLLAPAGISQEIRDKLSAAVAAAVKRPDIRQRLIDQGVDPTGSGPAEYDRILRSEIPKWSEVIKQANIKID